jgi:signal transduction histidine kinase
VLSLRAGIGTVVLQQAEDLARANTELARSNADLQSFTWVVAHDLREPLRNMQSFLGFFLEDHGAGISADGLEQLATVRRLSDRMDALMDSLIDHARADHLKPEPVTVSLGDRDAVTHILINLISNAMKYSPVDEPRIEVAAKPISETARGGPIGTMAISVRDFGIGIAPEFQDAVFDLFRRLHPRDAYGGGSGAGLAIARRLAERQGGELWLEHSSPDSGSVFCFSLPGA